VRELVLLLRVAPSSVPPPRALPIEVPPFAPPLPPSPSVSRPPSAAAPPPDPGRLRETGDSLLRFPRANKAAWLNEE
jgi:hypothetical protein